MTRLIVVVFFATLAACVDHEPDVTAPISPTDA